MVVVLVFIVHIVITLPPPPLIMEYNILSQSYTFYGYLTKNKTLEDAYDPDLLIALLESSECPNFQLSSYCDFEGLYIFAQDSKLQYLGKITSNNYDSESIINDFGAYGNPYSSTSIRNEFSDYGSSYGTYSAYNDFALYPPRIVEYNEATQSFDFIAYLTTNTTFTDRVTPDILFSVLENNVCPTILFVNPIISNITCIGNLDGKIETYVTGGIYPYTYLWSTGDATSEINNLAPGVYTLSITDSEGFNTTDQFEIIEPDPLIIQAIKTDVSCHGYSDGQVQLTLSGGTPPYTLLPQSNPMIIPTVTFTGLSAGTYYYTFVDANGCPATDSVTILQPDSLKIQKSIKNVTCPGGSDGLISLNVNGGTIPYQYQWSTGNDSSRLVNIPAGYYTIKISDANECVLLDTIAVNQPDEVTVIKQIEPILCHGDCATLSFDITGGTPPWNWEINPQVIDSCYVAGLYNVTITDAVGCSSTASFVIEEPGPLLVDLNTSPSCYGDSTGSISTAVTGGTPPYQYLWNNNKSTPGLSGITKGVYTVTVTDNNACNTVAIDSVIEYPEILTGQITGQTNVNTSELHVYSVLEKSTSIFSWNLRGGNIISGQGTNSINVKWDSTGLGLVSIVETDEHGCYGDTVRLEIQIGTTGLRDPFKSKLRIYPNPTDDVLTIETNRLGQYNIYITSLNGQLLFNSTVEGPTHQIDLSTLQKGLYFITVRSRDFVRTEKLIKQ